jgi:hypothetical protein
MRSLMRSSKFFMAFTVTGRVDADRGGPFL